jgi:hypothetical protein
MERLRGPTQTVSSLLKLSVGKQKGDRKIEKWEWFRKPTVSLYIMDAHITESSYILVGPYRIQNSLNGFVA